MKKVIVITGIGGMGLAIARRIGAGYKLVLADFAKDKLDDAVKSLTDAGYDVQAVTLDIINKDSVEDLAETAGELGLIHAVIHTAGLSPTMSDAQRILDVNLIGTARIIEAFEKQVTSGSVGVMISSMAGHNSTPHDQQLETVNWAQNADQIKASIDSLQIKESGEAYTVSKKGNILQVQAAALTWGAKGARIVSISPGIISTPMGQKEQKEQPAMNYMIENGPVKRIGTPEDIAAAVDFLQSPQASFITGTDLLVDGGVTAFSKKLSLGQKDK